MFVIVGLGNPGNKYSKTRHNIGFRVIDCLAERQKIQLQEKDIYYIGKGVLQGFDFILVKPLTFMNRSGIAVSKILKKRGVTPQDIKDKLIVIHDDIDLDIGVVKIKKNSSSGGHRGILSIIEQIDTKEFIRVKIGIGKDTDIAVEDYVLKCFRSSEKNAIETAIIKSCDAVIAIILLGVNRAINIYNLIKKKI